MSRNELYWGELVKMQDEAFDDNESVLVYLKTKHAAFHAFASAIDSIQTRRGSNSNNSSPSISNQISSSSLSTGHKSTQELMNLDKVWARRIFGMLE